MGDGGWVGAAPLCDMSLMCGFFSGSTPPPPVEFFEASKKNFGSK